MCELCSDDSQRDRSRVRGEVPLPNVPLPSQPPPEDGRGVDPPSLGPWVTIPGSYRLDRELVEEMANDPLMRALEVIADLVSKATEYGLQDGDFVASYIVPTGPVHRAIPFLAEFGIHVRPKGAEDDG